MLGLGQEQKITARTRKTRKFFVFLRERRHELLDAAFQHTLAQSYSPEPTGKAPVEVGLLALAGICLRRDNWVSVRYAEELNSGKSSATLQRVDRHGILGQKSPHFQESL